MIKIKRTLQIGFFTLLSFVFTYQVSALTDTPDKVNFSIGGALKDSKFSSVQEVIAEFLKWIINIGVVAVTLAFIYTGFQFVAARGNPEALQKAKASFLWTVVGTLVLLGAQVLSEVIKNTLTQGGIGV